MMYFIFARKSANDEERQIQNWRRGGDSNPRYRLNTSMAV